MFQEKKQEVQTAILRVDQLSQQLEDLKRGKLSGLQSYSGKLAGPAAAELKRLCQELQVTRWVWGVVTLNISQAFFPAWVEASNWKQVNGS